MFRYREQNFYIPIKFDDLHFSRFDHAATVRLMTSFNSYCSSKFLTYHVSNNLVNILTSEFLEDKQMIHFPFLRKRCLSKTRLILYLVIFSKIALIYIINASDQSTSRLIIWVFRWLNKEKYQKIRCDEYSSCDASYTGIFEIVTKTIFNL